MAEVFVSEIRQCIQHSYIKFQEHFVGLFCRFCFHKWTELCVDFRSIHFPHHSQEQIIYLIPYNNALLNLTFYFKSLILEVQKTGGGL